MNKLKYLLLITALSISIFNLSQPLNAFYSEGYTYSANSSPVSRFYDSNIGAHFFTSNKYESEYVKANDPRWSFESKTFSVVDYKLFPHDQTMKCAQEIDESPVYRFYRPSTMTHFYTIDESEKNNIIANDSSWTFEGVAYCAFNKKEFGEYENYRTPLFRFYRESTRTHFFTIDEFERDSIIANDKSWKFEGTAFYVKKLLSIYDSLNNNPLDYYSEFVKAFEAAGISDIITTRKNITALVFPNFVVYQYKEANPGKWEQMLANPDKTEIRSILLNHIFEGEILYKEIGAKTELTSLSGNSYTVGFDPERYGILLDGKEFYSADSPVSNGYMHIYEKLLIK